MGCKDKNKFVTAEASSKASLKSKGAIDEFLNIKDENLFRRLNREWSNNAKERFGITEKLFLEENGRVFPNKAAFKIIDNSKGVFYQNIQSENSEERVASEKTIRDLAARLSDRIGLPYRIITDRTQKFKGKIENGVAIVNLAYATLDTPIHEILGHPIIRAIKKRGATNYGKDSFMQMVEDDLTEDSQLYKNLLKELETGIGKEVLDRIKRDYNKKEYTPNINSIDKSENYIKDGWYYSLKVNPFSAIRYKIESNGEVNFSWKEFITKEQFIENRPIVSYTLEEQQEEALVELLGMMTADKLDKTTYDRLISLLKKLLAQINNVIKDLIRSKEINIDSLPDNLTLKDLSDILAYSNSKLILPGYEVEYTTPDNMKFKTYQEASNYISELAKNTEDVDLENFTPVNKWRVTGISWGYDQDGSVEQNGRINEEFDTKEEAEEYYNRMNNTKYAGELTINESNSLPKSFIDKNKEYEQSKEIIEEWKKVNNIVYNPEEIYSRGQEFSSVVGAYSSFDVNLMMQNLLQHIEDNEKAGGKFAISAFTKPIDRKIGHLEGGGSKIKFKIYPKSKDILWAANTDVYSGSVWDASEKVNKDKKSELLGVSYTKYPSLPNVTSVQPNLASVVDNLGHHHNELGIALTGNNFRLEYDEDIPYQTKKIIDGINSILDQKYGKLVKPDTSKKILKSEKIYEVRWKSNGGVIIRTTDLNKAKAEMQGVYTDSEGNELKPEDVIELVEGNPIEQIGIQPTQTKETLKESIIAVQNKLDNRDNLLPTKFLTKGKSKGYSLDTWFYKENGEWYMKNVPYDAPFDTEVESYDITKMSDAGLSIDEVWESYIKENPNSPVTTQKEKQYTSQALINSKIAALKQFAKAQPRSLIRSEVVPINLTTTTNVDLGFEDELPFQRIPSEKEKPTTTLASPKTIKLLRDFIKSIGVVIKDVKTINVNGVKYDGNGIAMLMQKLIQVVEGTEAQSLPEEAMHFAVAIIKQTNPKLYKKLMSEINNYQMLQDVFDTYGNDPDYQIDGKPDVIALKEEAIAKVLAQTIINNNENSSEKPEMVAKSQSWWMDILDALKNLFIKSGFDKLSMDIISGKKIGTAADIREDENRFFLQKTKQEEVVNRIREVSDKITLEPVKNEAGGEENKYFINGQQIKNRVSNIIKTYYDILRSDKALNDSEYKKATNTLKADKGTAGHKDKEHAMEIMLDENGRLKSKDELDAIFANDNHVSFIDPNNNDMYIVLRNNLRKRMESFPKDTVFMSEITVYDAKRNLAGTVDFLAITPEGKVNILDWKFVGLNVERYKDIPWYNVSSWNKQMAQYKIILRDNYGINEKDFEQTRMIPIRAIYSDGDAKKNILPVLLEVEIGDANVKNIKSDYLLPVGLQNEKVVIENNPEASERINKLLEKLNDVYTKLSDQKVLPSERLDKAEQLNALYSAIRQLQMRQDIRPLLYQAKVLNVQIQGIIQKYNDEIKSKDESELSNDEIEEFVKTLKIAEDALGYYTNLDTELEFLFEGSISEEDKNLSVELRETVYNSRKLKETLSKVFTEFTVEKIGGTEQGEKIVKDVFSKWLGTTSTIQLEGMAALFKKANAAFGRAGMDTQTEVTRLKELKKSFEQWAARKGLSKGNMFSMIKKKDSNELIDQYQDTFYDTLNRKIQTKDFTWIRDNVDVAAYQDYLNEKIEKERKRIEDKPRLGTEEQNYNEITREWFDLKNLYDISTPQSVGWLLYNDVKKFPKDKWETNEWKDLHKKENEAALNFYNYIIERNEVYAKTGYIPAGSARVFLPWVRKGLMEKLAMGGKITIGEQFLKNISVDEEEIGFGKFDPINGKPINRLPKYLTSKFEEQYSEDLFKTMAMYNEFAIKFQYLSSIENQALALLRLEENKQAIATSKFGRTNIKNGEIQYTNNNDENSKLLEDMIKAIVYQQKYIESESYDQLLGNLGNFGKNINKTLGFKLLPENLDGRQISINKAITHLNNTFQVTALGLNILSASSNYFGGTAQGLVNAGKYFTKAEYAASEAWLLSFKMAGNLDKQKVLAALDYFIPFTDNYNRRAATKLSLNKLDDQAIQDWLMSLMRGGDEAVQTVNFVSFLKNSIIVDGKVVNSREYLRNTDEYRDFYQGTQSERDARADKFEKDVKAINEKQGVLALSTVVNGELVIPGVERKSDSVIELRRKVQSFTADALGSMTEENKRLMNLNIYGNSFMVFKNWIPRLVDVRFGNIKYNAASDAYEWGRTRMITRIITDDLKGAIGNLKNSLMGNDKGMEYIRQLYEKKRADYKADTNKELKMTESEFIDLVRGNIKNQLLDLIFYATLWAITLGLKALAPDDDEDPSVRNRWNFMLKATDKFKDELGYFYNPGSLISIPQKGIFPALGLLNNYEKAVEGFLKETYALGTGDDELAEDTKTIKYWMKTNPITNQAAGMLPIFYPELAKDLGIRMQSQYGIR